MLLNVVESIYCVRFGAQINRTTLENESPWAAKGEKKMSSSITLLWKMWKNWDTQHSRLEKCIKSGLASYRRKTTEKYLQFLGILKFCSDSPPTQAPRRSQAATPLNQLLDVKWNQFPVRLTLHCATFSSSSFSSENVCFLSSTELWYHFDEWYECQWIIPK